MPAIINGPLEISTIGGSGIVNFGSALSVSPKNTSKTVSGSGGFCSAISIFTTSGLSSTNVIDPSLADQPSVGNN